MPVPTPYLPFPPFPPFALFTPRPAGVTSYRTMDGPRSLQEDKAMTRRKLLAASQASRSSDSRRRSPSGRTRTPTTWIG